MSARLKLLPRVALFSALSIACAVPGGFVPAQEVFQQAASDAKLLLRPQSTSSLKSLAATDLRCEQQCEPLGIGETAPRLSWILRTQEPSQIQTAFRVLVASSKELLGRNQGDLWDTGVANEKTCGTAYDGKELHSHQRCFWKVKLWNTLGQESAWSETACWSMGLMKAADCRAEWIGRHPRQVQVPPGRGEPESGVARENRMNARELPRPASYLRAQFRIDKPLSRAVLYASALGLADMYLNGRRVTEDYFMSGGSVHKREAYYRAYDVTDLIRFGENAIGAVLASSRDSESKGEDDEQGEQPRLWAQLRLEFNDESTDEVLTGPHWRATTGPIVSADLFGGEIYDGRLERSGWSQPGGDDGQWESVYVDDMQPTLRAHSGAPVRAVGELKARKINEPKPGVYLVDFGQKFTGVVRLQVSGKPGQRITLHFAERLNSEGTIYKPTDPRATRGMDAYICKGKATEVWQPRFAFHKFQYVEITGMNSSPGNETLTGVALSGDEPGSGESAGIGAGRLIASD